MDLARLARLAERSAQLREAVLEKEAGVFNALASGAEKATSAAAASGAKQVTQAPFKWGIGAKMIAGGAQMVGKGALGVGRWAAQHPLQALGAGMAGAAMYSGGKAAKREFSSGFNQEDQMDSYPGA